jgi:alpha-beta hydrolase superfamily lysophospholipase
MTATTKQAPLAGVTHHYAKVNGTKLRYVSAGTKGTPVLLVHGFPETWWTVRKLIPVLAASHRVYAVDLRGFGDSDNEPGAYDSRPSAEGLHQLIEELNVGPRAPDRPRHQRGHCLRLAATHDQVAHALLDFFSTVDAT